MRCSVFLRLSALSCLIFIANCELFYPDSQVERPEIIENDDPFSFASLLTNTPIGFNKLSYENLFHEHFSYHGNDNQIFSRRQEIDRLEQIQRLYNKVQVVWDTTSSSNDPPLFNPNDTITIYRKYSVTTFKETKDPTDTTKTILVQKKHNGTSRFDLIYHAIKNTWCILRWYDENSQTGLTIFHPEYSE